MGRIRFPKGEQKNWIDDVLKVSGLDTRRVAKLCGVSPRTIRDWRREKFTISESSCKILSKEFGMEIPGEATVISTYWYVAMGAKKGALKRIELYGPPGTKEGRVLGGLMSQKRRREDPEKYRLLGCNISKDFKVLKKSDKLAEMVGIILGDGGVSNYQVKITLNRETDRLYADNVASLISEAFGDYPRWYDHSGENVIDLCNSGEKLVKELDKIGILKGDKIKNQVDFPSWIWNKKSYVRACTRGLMDTDGCVYLHYHSTGGIKYRNIGICFTNHSKPLVLSFSKALTGENVKHSICDKQRRVYVYDLEEVKKYIKIFGSSNPKHVEKLKYHLSHGRRLS